MRGRVWKLGDDIDTNQLAPGQTPEMLGLSGAAAREHLVRGCLSAIRPGLAALVRPGDILVAESLARLFFRNSVAFGAPAIECPGIAALVEEGDRLEIDLAAGRLHNLDRGGALDFAPPTPTVRDILAAGGMLALLRQRLGPAADE